MQHQEVDRQTRRRDGSTEAQRWVFERRKQVPCGELVPFGISAGGWEREMALPRAFVPHRAELCLLGLNTSPSHCPLALPLSEQSCWLITFQMLSPTGCQNSCSPASPLLQVRLGGSALLGRLPLHHPGSLPPVPVVPTASPPFLPSSVGLSSMLGSRESVQLVFWQFSGLFRQMWVESK